MEDLDLPFIGINDVEAAYVNTSYLIENNHLEIGAIFKSDDKQGKERLKGFVTALSEHGLPYRNENIVMYATEDRDQRLLSEVSDLIDRKEVTGIVCYNDIIALEVLNICTAKGIRIPQDVSIVSFDNSILSMLTSTKITSISHPQTILGSDAAREIIKMVEDKNYRFNGIVYPVNLDIKESVKELK